MKINTKSVRRRLIGIVGDIALLLVFTYLWEHVNETVEHYGTMIGFSFLRMAMHNQLHSSAHNLMHSLMHRIQHVVVAKK